MPNCTAPPHPRLPRRRTVSPRVPRSRDQPASIECTHWGVAETVLEFPPGIAIDLHETRRTFDVFDDYLAFGPDSGGQP